MQIAIMKVSRINIVSEILNYCLFYYRQLDVVIFLSIPDMYFSYAVHQPKGRINADVAHIYTVNCLRPFYWYLIRVASRFN